MVGWKGVGGRGPSVTTVAGPFGAGFTTTPSRSPRSDTRFIARSKVLCTLQTWPSESIRTAISSNDRATTRPGSPNGRATIQSTAPASHKGRPPPWRLIPSARDPDRGTTSSLPRRAGMTLCSTGRSRRNAMTWAMYERLHQACDEVDADDSIRVLVLRGAGGKSFVAGTDISQFKAFETKEDGLAVRARGREAVRPRRPSQQAGHRDASRGSPSAAASRWRLAVTSGSPRRTRSSACRSRGRSATACRWRPTRGSST